MFESKYDSAIAEVMTHCASDSQIQNALADQTPDCIIALQDRAMEYIRQSSVFSEENEADQRQTAKLIADDLLRFGPIVKLLWDPEVTEIMVNAPDSVWVERQGKIKPTDIQFRDEEHVLRTIERIVSSNGCRCDSRNRQYVCTLHRERAPFDGSRVSAMVDDIDGHRFLNINKRSKDNVIDTIFQSIDLDSCANNLVDYYRSIASDRMGISDGCPDKIILPRNRQSERPDTGRNSHE